MPVLATVPTALRGSLPLGAMRPGGDVVRQGALALALCGAGLVLPLAAQAQDKVADAWWGEVTYVVDGDSLWIRPEGARSRKPQRVRLAGVDAPEICQDSGRAAQQFLSQRVLHQRVQVDARARDGYGRLIAQVSHQGRDLSQWMARAGWAWSPGFRRSPGPHAADVAQAQAARLGLFADAKPTLPADFRRVHGPCRPPNKP